MRYSKCLQKSPLRVSLGKIYFTLLSLFKFISLTSHCMWPNILTCLLFLFLSLSLFLTHKISLCRISSVTSRLPDYRGPRLQGPVARLKEAWLLGRTRSPPRDTNFRREWERDREKETEKAASHRCFFFSPSWTSWYCFDHYPGPPQLSKFFFLYLVWQGVCPRGVSRGHVQVQLHYSDDIQGQCPSPTVSYINILVMPSIHFNFVFCCSWLFFCEVTWWLLWACLFRPAPKKQHSCPS